MKLVMISVLLGVTFSLTLQADTFPGIKALMTPEQFEAAGLQRLSAKEIEQLDRWLMQSSALELRDDSSDAPLAPHAAVEEPQEILSNIAGEFTGWSGKTQFHLTNGQVWEQRYSGVWRVRLEQPAVRIQRNFLGLYQLEVVGQDRSIGVTRVR